MSFANAAMLLGLTGVAIPIVIHFFSRNRLPNIDWGGMRFLELGQRAQTRVQLEHWLLMLARMLPLALLAFAAARPTFQSNGQTTTGPREIVIVLDTSALMRYQGIDDSRPIDEAIDWIKGMVDQLGPGDRLGLIFAGTRVRLMTDELSGDPIQILEAIEEPIPCAGTGDFVAALAAAEGMLSDNREHHQLIYILSDGRSGPWHLDQPGRWALFNELWSDRLPSAQIVAMAFPVDQDPNAADGSIKQVEIPRATITIGSTAFLDVTVANNGPAAFDRQLRLIIDGEPLDGALTDSGLLPPGASTEVRLQVNLEEPGIHLVTVGFDDDPAGIRDPLSLNDQAPAIIEVQERISILGVDGAPRLEPLTGELDFFRLAIGSLENGSTAFDLTIIEPPQLSRAALRTHSILVLANLPTLSRDQYQMIATFLSRGKSVFVVSGDQLDPGQWNELVDAGNPSWLPCRFRELIDLDAGASLGAKPAASTFRGPLLAPFEVGSALSIEEARFESWWILEPTSSDPPPVVLAELESGHPWLIESPFQSGHVLVMSTPIDADGGTLPVNPDFVPLIQELVAYLARGSVPVVGGSVGAPLIVRTTSETEPSVAITPSGNVVTVNREMAAGGTQFWIDTTDEPGVYRFQEDGGEEPVAVGIVRDEPDAIDLSKLDADSQALIKDTLAVRFEVEKSQPATQAEQYRPHPVLRSWRLLIFLGLMSLLLESWLTGYRALRATRPR